MSEYFTPERPIYPACQLPPLDSMVWRYMDFEKFSYLIEKQALYMRRADLLEDKFEGTFSREQIIDLNEWLDRQEVPREISEGEKEFREKIRHNTYLSCWGLGDSDLDLMWKSYVGVEKEGIAICSTVQQLQDICDDAITYWPIDLSEVNYRNLAGGEMIEYDRISPFLTKDNHYRLDCEIRIIHWPNSQTPGPDNVDIPINASNLINRVVLKPKISESHASNIKKMLDTNGLGHVPIEFSRNDREHPE